MKTATKVLILVLLEKFLQYAKHDIKLWHEREKKGGNTHKI